MLSTFLLQRCSSYCCNTVHVSVTTMSTFLLPKCCPRFCYDNVVHVSVTTSPRFCYNNVQDSATTISSLQASWTTVTAARASTCSDTSTRSRRGWRHRSATRYSASTRRSVTRWLGVVKPFERQRHLNLTSANKPCAPMTALVDDNTPRNINWCSRPSCLVLLFCSAGLILWLSIGVRSLE